MVELPSPFPQTVEAVYASLAKEAHCGDSSGISFSEATNPCDRALWYALHWCAPPRPFDGPGASRLRTGLQWEDRLIDDLASIGCIFENHQQRVRLAGGYLRGKVDATATGLREAPKTEHLVECKSLKAEAFRAVVKHGVKKAEPKHWAQCQLYMHALALTRAAYWCVNKNTDERHLERIEYDPVFNIQVEARIERIALADEPPPRLRDDPAAWECLFCASSAICHSGKFARVNCRTCAHGTVNPENLTCERDGSLRNYSAQQQGCASHRFVPALVPGEQIDVREPDLIVYQMADGSEWVDGAVK
jgi:hypothetical protein